MNRKKIARKPIWVSVVRRSVDNDDDLNIYLTVCIDLPCASIGIKINLQKYLNI